MRPSYDVRASVTIPPPPTEPRRSATPIFDALYAEYRRSFRALPGDRTGEEELSSEALRGIWRRTTRSTGDWELVGRLPHRPQHARARVPAALPPGGDWSAEQ
ncbi:hypothetical protein [Streptomyces sp. NPDC003077]|uniref:hypothetical protein n=1 Tax=Streptomyces sp. NPDC003077 TaxID=3154443 RepID=UPI0033B4E6AD